MFWGCIVKKDQPYKVQHALENGEFPVLHLSNAALSQPAKGDEKTQVRISMKPEKKDEKAVKDLIIAILSPKQEVQSLDLYLNISQNITISVTGKGEVHLSGYFESNQSIEEDYYGGAGLGEEDEEEGENEMNLEDDSSDDDEADKKKEIEGFKKGGDLDKSLKTAKKNAVKNTIPDDDEDDEDDSDMEEGELDLFGDDEEGEAEDLEVDSEDGSSDEKDEALAKVKAIKNRTQ